MKIKRLLGRVIFYGSALAFLNYFNLPLGTFVASEMFKNDTKDKRIQQVCKTDSYLENIISSIDSKNCEALHLLKAAHAITSKWLSIDNNQSIFSEKKRALEEGKAVCKYYSTFTYSNFLYLADKIGRPDLKDKVRLCTGFVKEGNELAGGHCWLQVYFKDKWADYEATIDFISKKEEIDFKQLDIKLDNKYFLNNGGLYHSSFVQHENDKLVNYTNVLFSKESGIEIRHFLSYVGKNCYYNIKDYVVKDGYEYIKKNADNIKEKVDNVLKKLKEYKL